MQWASLSLHSVLSSLASQVLSPYAPPSACSTPPPAYSHNRTSPSSSPESPGRASLTPRSGHAPPYLVFMEPFMTLMFSSPTFYLQLFYLQHSTQHATAPCMRMKLKNIPLMNEVFQGMIVQLNPKHLSESVPFPS